MKFKIPRDPAGRRGLACGVLLAVMLVGMLAWRFTLSVPAELGADAPLPRQGQRLSGPASIYDADTLGVQGMRLRLAGIDAPEFTQPCGAKNRQWSCGTRAMIALRERLRGQPLECIVEGVDRYRRGLARCSSQGQDINRWLVRNGWALATDDEYLADAALAERDRAGMWRDVFVRPADWRRMQAGR